VVAGKGERGGDSKLPAVPAPASDSGAGVEAPAEIAWVPRPAAGLPSEPQIWQTGLALAVAYLLFAVSIYIMAPSLKPSLLWLVFVACSVVMAAVFLAMLSFRNQLQLRIGSDGRSVVIADADGEIARCAFGSACASGSRLLADRRLVLLRTVWGSDLVEREPFCALIFDRLAPSHRMGRLQFDLHLLRIAHPATVIGRVLIGLGVLAALAAMFWPILGRLFSD
jgi:hypothetical protein